MYVRESEMHPELREMLANRGSETVDIFDLERLRGCWRDQVSQPMMEESRQRAIVLWPDGAPGAAGTGPGDVPLLYPVPSGTQDAPRPAMIVCPGGGFRSLVPWEGFPFAEWFGELGLAVFVLRYRLLPYLAAACIEDGRRAVRWVRAHADEFGVDADRIGMIGFSAGGYVTAAVSTMHDGGDPDAADPIERHSSRPDLSALFYPVTQVLGLGLMGLLVGNDPQLDPELARRYSPSLRVNRDTPPAYLYGLRTDQLLAPNHVLDYASACQRHDVPFELHLYGYGLHGAGVGGADPRLNWQESLTHWLAAQGFLPQGTAR